MSVKTAKLQNELTQLQKSGRVVLAELRTANLKLYIHLVTLLFWWLDAKKIDEFLEKEYKTIGLKRAPKIVVYGINFSPLMKLAYGYNRLTDERIDVYSRALNEALKQFQNNPKLYKSDHINKLANFIDNTEGGLGKLSGYKKDKSNKTDKLDEVVSTEAASSNDAVDSAITTPVAVVVNNVAVNIKENKRVTT